MATSIYTLSELRDEQARLNGRDYILRPCPRGFGLAGSATWRRRRVERVIRRVAFLLFHGAIIAAAFSIVL